MGSGSGTEKAFADTAFETLDYGFAPCDDPVRLLRIPTAGSAPRRLTL